MSITPDFGGKEKEDDIEMNELGQKASEETGKPIDC